MEFSIKPKLYATVEYKTGLAVKELYPVLTGLMKGSWAKPIIIYQTEFNLRATYTCNQHMAWAFPKDYIVLADVDAAQELIKTKLKTKLDENRKSGENEENGRIKEHIYQIGLDLMQCSYQGNKIERIISLDSRDMNVILELAGKSHKDISLTCRSGELSFSWELGGLTLIIVVNWVKKWFIKY